MKVKYSNISNLQISSLLEIKKLLISSINVAKKYGSSIFEIGKLSISFCSFEDDNGKISVSSYIDIKGGGCILRDYRSINEILKIIKTVYPIIK